MRRQRKKYRPSKAAAQAEAARLLLDETERVSSAVTDAWNNWLSGATPNGSDDIGSLTCAAVARLRMAWTLARRSGNEFIPIRQALADMIMELESFRSSLKKQ